MNRYKVEDTDQLYQRFLEYYISENEFFLKVYCSKKFIGLIKGRVEFKNQGEVWVGYFFLSKDEINDIECSLDNKIIEILVKYFIDEYGINNFYTSISKEDEEGLEFWKKNGYKILRVSKNYYEFNGIYEDMLILKKTNIAKI